jgi:hypothetical protein
VPFADFVKAHLKLPEQRNLGLQWQQVQAASGAQVEAIWRGDIGKPLGIRHFADLWQKQRGMAMPRFCSSGRQHCQHETNSRLRICHKFSSWSQPCSKSVT